jgi:dUTP pyrophosphatase
LVKIDQQVDLSSKTAPSYNSRGAFVFASGVFIVYTAEYTIKGYKIVLESKYGHKYLPQQARQFDAGFDLRARVEQKVSLVQGSLLPELVYVDGVPVPGKKLVASVRPEHIYIPPGQTKLVPTGLKWRVSLEGEAESVLALLLFARSGLAARCGLSLANGVGVVDMMYPEEIMVALRNESEYGHYIHDGSRIAQGLLVEVLSLGNGVGKRTSGFGHTGVVG